MAVQQLVSAKPCHNRGAWLLALAILLALGKQMLILPREWYVSKDI